MGIERLLYLRRVSWHWDTLRGTSAGRWFLFIGILSFSQYLSELREWGSFNALSFSFKARHCCWYRSFPSDDLRCQNSGHHMLKNPANYGVIGHLSSPSAILVLLGFFVYLRFGVF